MKNRRLIGAGAAAGALVLAGAVATPAFAASQEVTNITDPAVLNAEQLVASLIGDDTVVSNVTYTGSPLGAGYATGFNDPFGIDSGVVLSSGSVADADGYDSAIIGPNEWEGNGAALDQPGDPDLEAIVESNTYDAAVLEFDFVPTSSTVTFSYVFGSEEYEEYVDAGVNDVFGFFVNGTNYATIENGSIPVSIDTINHQVNTAYYRSNAEATTYNTELDGFTVVLSFEAEVTPNATNHIKLAIADTGDDILDSAVIIAAGSFKSNTAPVAMDVTKETEFETPIDVTLQGTDADGDALTYSILDGPTAEQGTLSAVDGNKVTFTPAEGFTGDATFTYRVNDGSVNSAPATVTITVLEEGVVIPPTTTTPPTTEEPTTPPTTEEPTESAIPTKTAEPTTTEAPTTDTDDEDHLASTGASDMGLIIGLSAALLAAGGALFAATKLRRQA